MLLVTENRGYLITDSRYLSRPGNRLRLYSGSLGTENLSAYLEPPLVENRTDLLGFEEDHLSYSTHEKLASRLKVELIPGGGLVEQLRAVKYPEEIDLLRRGAAMTDQAFEHILGFIEPGLTEQQVALELEYYLRLKGAEGASFTYIVVSGVRGAMPHGVAGKKVLQRGELVTIDFGAVWDGYATDMTRPLPWGRPPKKEYTGWWRKPSSGPGKGSGPDCPAVKSMRWPGTPSPRPGLGSTSVTDWAMG